jgi:hypothetical protein
MHAVKEPNGDRTAELIRDAATEDIAILVQPTEGLSSNCRFKSSL